MLKYKTIFDMVLCVTFVLSDILNSQPPYSTETKFHQISLTNAEEKTLKTTHRNFSKFDTVLGQNQEVSMETLALPNFESDDLDLNITLPWHEDIGVIYDYSENYLDNNSNFLVEKMNENIIIRKCCQTNEFFSNSAVKCVTSEEPEIFHDRIEKFTNSSLSIFSKRLEEECGDRVAALMNQNSHFSFVGDGKLEDSFLGNVYNQTEYCLELVGDTAENSELVLTYCPKRIVLPKCCGLGLFYNDSNVPDCIPNVSSTEVVVEEATLLPNTENYELGYSDLQCQDQMIWLDLNETRFNGTSLCLNKNETCYDFDKYCIDNMLQKETLKIVKAALVCPEYNVFICCPKGEGFIEQKCRKNIHSSSYLNDELNKFRFEVKPIFIQTSNCNVRKIINDTISDISWSINAEGKAVLTNENNITIVDNYCIDYHISEEGVVPALLICSEEHLALKSWFENLLGKCCPHRMVFRRQIGEVEESCMAEQANVRRLTETEEFMRFHVKNLQYSNFPNCPDSNHYHHFLLGESITDYAILTENGSLNIVDMDNGCKVRETNIASSLFCLEYKFEGEQYIPHAFVCVPEPKNPHSEKTALIVTLVGISCAALTASFISLLFVRVQKGMLKVRKVNTLAGKILLSYVSSQLLGYLTLGVISLVDFGDDHMICLTLTGVLIFFMMAAFCWNSSICLECLLITVSHFRTSDSIRFLLHSIWAWGIPGVVTALTLIRNLNEDKLSCDAIKPQIGKDRCFFSDAKATLLYFYLPISITVIMNGVLLVISKIIRKTTLTKLGQSQCSIERHENVKKILSLQNVKDLLKREKTPATSSHSGLRAHQNKNITIEALKLVTWSGITWLMEILGTLVAMYGSRSHGEWYNYLWYIPVGCNCLRGLGISFIISFSTETQSKISRQVCSISSDLGASWSDFKSKTIRGYKSHYFKQNTLSVMEKFKFKGSLYGREDKSFSTINNYNNNSYANGLSKDNDNLDEIASMATVFTTISNSALAFNETPTPNFYHSVSRSDPIIGDNYLPDILESLECSVPIKEEEYLTYDLESLDNTLMESTFWDGVALKKSLEYKKSYKSNDSRTMNIKEKCTKTSTAFDCLDYTSGKIFKNLGVDNNEESRIDTLFGVKSYDNNKLRSNMKTEKTIYLNEPIYETTGHHVIQQACYEQECVCSLICENTYL